MNNKDRTVVSFKPRPFYLGENSPKQAKNEVGLWGGGRGGGQKLFDNFDALVPCMINI
jgi:hypothetical protein